MAVYTTLSNQQIQDFLSEHYALDLVSVKPISAGTENTNYHIHTCSHDTEIEAEFVLTLFESMPREALQQVIALTSALAQQNVPVPTAALSSQQETMQTLQGKPAILTSFVRGKDPQQASTEQCYQVAAALANIHQASDNTIQCTPYDLLQSLQGLHQQTSASLSHEEQQMVSKEIAYYAEFNNALTALPQGFMHTDLFKDNTLFDDGQLSAILDFYSAAQGTLLFDLAVMINDWCYTSDNAAIKDNFDAILHGYQSQRTLTSHETALLPLALRMTACRFWLSRTLLAQQHEGALEGKNPADFKARLLSHPSDQQYLKDSLQPL